MRRILLSIFMATVAMGANAQFKGSVDIRPRQDPEPYQISFNFSRVCKQLGVDSEEFGALLLREWAGMGGVQPEYSLYLLSDGGGGFTPDYELTLDGRKASYEERKWQVNIQRWGIEWNRLDFGIWPCADPEGDPLVKIGEVGHVVFALEYQGKVATFDITMNATEEDGPAIPLSSLEKVGEQVISGHYDFASEVMMKFDLKGVASLFGGDVEGGNLQLYVMKDAGQQLITTTSRVATSTRIKIDGMLSEDRKATDDYRVEYDAEVLLVDAGSDAFQGGQKTSGSVFLVADGKYYELMMDIQFGDEFEDQKSFNIVKTGQMDVQLEYTDTYFSYYNKETDRYGLISTDIDEDGIKALLGTDSPRLYAEQKKGDVYNFTSRYNAAPGQGFWFTSDEGQCYRSYGSELSIGVYYTEGSLKWYECPANEMRPGNKYKLNLYLANPENGKAVKYEIDVEIVKELQTESVAYVRSLPIGMGTPDGIEKVQEVQGSKGSKVQGLYDLQGRRLLKAPEKGLYIQGGVLRMK